MSSCSGKFDFLAFSFLRIIQLFKEINKFSLEPILVFTSAGKNIRCGNIREDRNNLNKLFISLKKKYKIANILNIFLQICEIRLNKN